MREQPSLLAVTGVASQLAIGEREAHIEALGSYVLSHRPAWRRRALPLVYAALRREMYQDLQCAWNISNTRKENPLRKAIASPFVTLDGFIAGPDGSLDWSVGDEAFDREQLPALLSRVDAILLGRLTYQELAAYWPFTSGEDDRDADLMNTIPKFVFSRTLAGASWGQFKNARVVKDDPAEAETARHQDLSFRCRGASLPA
jgi:dihydrofolate reductase